MKSYNHFLHCLDAKNSFTLFNTRQHCCELKQSGDIWTVHLCSCQVTDALTFAPHRHTRTSVVTLRLSCCVPSCCSAILWYKKHAPGGKKKSITADLQWTNMYMFTLKDVDNRWRSVVNHFAETWYITSSVCGTTGRFPISSFCGGTSFCFLKTV